MKTISLGLVMTVALCASAALGNDPEPQTTNLEQHTTGTVAPEIADPTTEVLDLELDRDRRFTLPVMVEGSGPYDFMVDTGSEATVVTSGISHALGLPPSGSATLVALASRRPVSLVEVGSMKFGSNEVTDLVSPVLERSNVGADGILGLDSLQDFRVVIDFRDETIAVQNVAEIERSGSDFEIIVRARREFGQLLITGADIEGVRATVIIDTGAQGSIGNTALLDRIRAQRAETVSAKDVNGVMLTGQMSYVRSLVIDRLQLADVPLIFADTPAFDALGLNERPAIALGMNHLRMFDRVAIDFSKQRVMFDVPREIERALRRDRRRGRLSGNR